MGENCLSASGAPGLPRLVLVHAPGCKERARDLAGVTWWGSRATLAPGCEDGTRALAGSRRSKTGGRSPSRPSGSASPIGASGSPRLPGALAVTKEAPGHLGATAGLPGHAGAAPRGRGLPAGLRGWGREASSGRGPRGPPWGGWGSALCAGLGLRGGGERCRGPSRRPVAATAQDATVGAQPCSWVTQGVTLARFDLAFPGFRPGVPPASLACPPLPGRPVSLLPRPHPRLCRPRQPCPGTL